MNRTIWYINNTKINCFFTFGDYHNLKDVRQDVLKHSDTRFDMKEIRDNTERIYDYNTDLYNSLVKYNAGDCGFNEKKSKNLS